MSSWLHFEADTSYQALCLDAMVEEDHSERSENEQMEIKIGFSFPASSPPIPVRKETVDGLRNGNENYQQRAYSEIVDWWNNLSEGERANVLRLSEIDGETIVENLIYIDKVTENQKQNEVLREL